MIDFLRFLVGSGKTVVEYDALAAYKNDRITGEQFLEIRAEPDWVRARALLNSYEPPSSPWGTRREV